MTIDEQVESHLKVLGYGDTAKISESLIWFVKWHDAILGASSKKNNLYHSVYEGLHDLLRRQLVTRKEIRSLKDSKRDKFCESNDGPLPLQTQVLLIKVVALYAVKVLNNRETSDDGLVELSYPVETGVCDELQDIVLNQRDPLLRESAIVGLGIINADGRKIYTAELLTTQGVVGCKRWRYQGYISVRRSKSGKLYFEAPGLGVTEQQVCGELFEVLYKEAMDRPGTMVMEIPSGRKYLRWRIGPVDAVFSRCETFKAVELEEDWTYAERFLKLEFLKMNRWDGWRDSVTSYDPPIITELREASQLYGEYIPTSKTFQDKMKRRYGRVAKLEFDVLGQLSDQIDTKGFSGLRRVVGVHHGKLYDFVSAKAYVRLGGEWKSCSVAIDSWRWDILAAECFADDLVLLKASCLIIKSNIDGEGRKREYYDLNSSVITAIESTRCMNGCASDSTSCRKRYPSTSEIMINRINESRLQRYNDIDNGGCGYDDDYDDVREDMGPWTNRPDYD